MRPTSTSETLEDFWETPVMIELAALSVSPSWRNRGAAHLAVQIDLCSSKR